MPCRGVSCYTFRFPSLQLDLSQLALHHSSPRSCPTTHAVLPTTTVWSPKVHARPRMSQQIVSHVSAERFTNPNWGSERSKHVQTQALSPGVESGWSGQTSKACLTLSLKLRVWSPSSGFSTKEADVSLGLPLRRERTLRSCKHRADRYVVNSTGVHGLWQPRQWKAREGLTFHRYSNCRARTLSSTGTEPI